MNLCILSECVAKHHLNLFIPFGRCKVDASLVESHFTIVTLFHLFEHKKYSKNKTMKYMLKQNQMIVCRFHGFYKFGLEHYDEHQEDAISICSQVHTYTHTHKHNHFDE